MIVNALLETKFSSGAEMRARANIAAQLPDIGITYSFKCFDRDGNLRWEEVVHNVVCTPGINDLLDKYFAGSGYTAAWYMLLAGTGTKAATDTLASHAGWSEITNYSGNRPSLSWNAAGAGAKAANPATFTITGAGPYTIAGAGLCTVATGTAGVLYSVVDFSVSRQLYLDDQLVVTANVGG